jgi:hypothetical protein
MISIFILILLYSIISTSIAKKSISVRTWVENVASFRLVDHVVVQQKL